MYDSTDDTINHIARVQDFMMECRSNLRDRASLHDQSKLYEPEKSMFDRAVSRLNEVEYGTPEYDEARRSLGPSLAHHYERNSHHPEHYAVSEVDDEGTYTWYTDDGDAVGRMSLFDVIEMLMDWKAATERMKDGDIWKSIEYNQERFGLSDQLTSILKNTAKEMGW